jgi:hypothetical protein
MSYIVILMSFTANFRSIGYGYTNTVHYLALFVAIMQLRYGHLIPFQYKYSDNNYIRVLLKHVRGVSHVSKYFQYCTLGLAAKFECNTHSNVFRVHTASQRN